MTGNQTTSEGMAYGMLIAVYMSDKPTFDAFWQYVQAHMANGLMSWQITSGGTPNGNGGVNSAADADEDMAWALIMADKQWPGGTLSRRAAQVAVVSNNKSQEVNGSNNIKDGNFQNAGSTHPDYAAPDYYKTFATVSGDTSWSSVYTAEYGQLTGAQNGSTGLIPDSVGGGTFGYDACRAPWRVGVDLIWSAAPRARRRSSRRWRTLPRATRVAERRPVMNIKTPPSRRWAAARAPTSSGAITGPAAVGAMYSAADRDASSTASYSYLYDCRHERDHRKAVPASITSAARWASSRC